MSEKLARVALDENTLVRVCCASCRGVVEANIDRIIAAYAKGQCPLCGEQMPHHDNWAAQVTEQLGQNPPPLPTLAFLLKRMTQDQHKTQIQFLVNVPDEP